MTNVKFGYWEKYGNDGRLRCHEEQPEWWDSKGCRDIQAGLGYRAYDAANPHGGDYAWSQVFDTYEEALRGGGAERVLSASSDVTQETGEAKDFAIYVDDVEGRDWIAEFSMFNESRTYSDLSYRSGALHLEYDQLHHACEVPQKVRDVVEKKQESLIAQETNDLIAIGDCDGWEPESADKAERRRSCRTPSASSGMKV